MANGRPGRWTVMVYLAGDNNLSDNMVWALQEMRDVDLTHDYSIVAQFDPRRGRPLRFHFGRGEPSPLPLIAERLDLEKIKGFIRDRTGKAARSWKYTRMDNAEDVERAARAIIRNSASPLMVEQFITSSRHDYPADHSMVVLSGHGHGAVGDFLQDTDPISALTVRKLGILLESATEAARRKIDILGMDSCNMSMAEVCYEVRTSADYLVGTESSVLNSGWPYRRVLGRLVEGGYATAESFADAIVREYIGYYSDYVIAGVSTDCAAIRLERMESLADKVADFSYALKAALKTEDGRDAIRMAHLEAQSYKNEEYVDLWDFCDRAGARHGSLAKSADGVKDEIESAVVRSCYSGSAFQYSRGLSVYFPWSLSAFAPGYQELSFSKASNWGNFLEEYLEKTVRDVRIPRETVTSEPLDFPSVNESLLQIRRDPPDSKGIESEFRIKNFPEKFMLDDCGR